MKSVKRILSLVLPLLILLSLCLSAAPAVFAAEYEDGTYQVPLSAEGLGRHNVVWSTATVHVSGGAITVDFTFERVDPRDHAPQYDFLVTSLGTFYPVLNDEACTCTFYGVAVEALGTVSVSVQTSAMSQPYMVDYTLHIDGSSIPLKKEESKQESSSESSASSQSSSASSQSSSQASSSEPSKQESSSQSSAASSSASSEVSETSSKPAESKPTESSKSEVPQDEVSKAAEPSETGSTASSQPASSAASVPSPAEASGGLGAGAIIGIAAGALLVIGCAVFLVLRKKK